VSPTFIHGSNATVYQDGNDLTGYLRSLSNSAEVETAESTTFADDDKTYIAGLADATISAEGLFDASFDGELNSITGSGTKSVWSVYPAGDAAGSQGRGYSLDVTAAERTAEIGDVVMVSIEGQSSVGTEPIISHHALAQRSTSGTASVVDNAASSANGGYGYLHATSASGTVVVKVQHSSDNSTYADYLTIGTITASARSFRTTATGTVNRYTRLVYTITSGTATFVAGFGRN
jgi:hypothetical protein